MSVSYYKLADELMRGMSCSTRNSWTQDNKYLATPEEMHTALLMDIAKSLRAIRAKLDCQNTIEIPHILRDIRRNTTKPRKRKVVKKRRAKR